MEELPQFKTNIFMFTELVQESRKLNFPAYRFIYYFVRPAA